MGMDVYGRNPRSKAGEYFRNNVWGWRPLWDYCEQAAPDLIPKNNNGHTNDGWGLNCTRSLALAKRLTELLDSGEVKKYEIGYIKMTETIPLENCSVCGGTGKRLPPPKVGPGDQPCNGCKGKGKRESINAGYVFDEKNIREFRDFLLECGGFKIC
jgi:hypothetical protein